jgi:AcrR family transcriptional regulator
VYYLVRNEDCTVPTGRPREFDADKALDRALKVFWRKGYQGATLPDLTKAMGINRPSLYAAFGNKESLFRKAIDRYLAGPASHVASALGEPTARAVVERFLLCSIDMATDPRYPRGCFMVQGALACGDAAECLRREMARQRAAAQTALRERFVRAIREEDLSAGTNPADLARYVATITQGIAVQAAGGATRAELRRIADMALGSLPATTKHRKRPRAKQL